MTGKDLCTNILVELNIYGAADPPSPEDLNLVLTKVNRIFDSWNAKHQASYCETFADYTLTPALSPHTIGPTGVWVVAQRPVSLEDASLDDGSGVQSPIWVRDAAWYAGRTTPAQTGSRPTDVYYEKAWPNGKLFFWPVPTSAYTVALLSRTVLAALTLDTTFTMPPGYEDAITLTGMESAVGAFPGSVTQPSLKGDASMARAVIFSNNVDTPKLRTADAGMPGRGRGGYFNYRTGELE